MRSSLKSVFACTAVLAVSGMALAQQGHDPKKPTTPPANTKPAAPSAAQPKGDKPAAAAPGMEEMMAAMRPGEMHKKLEPMVGNFDVVVKFWMAPGMPEQSSKGSSSNKWVYDGRFVEQSFSGEMMNMPFKGTGYTGFNTVAKQYESFWMDSMSTGMMMSSGKLSDDGKTINWSGESDDPATGKRVKIRMVTKMTDANSHTMEMYAPGPDGKEFKTMEIVYTRSGASPAKPEGAKPEAAKPAPTGNTPAPKK